MDHIDIVFDGSPSHIAPRFVEVENQDGESIRFGEWVHRDDGYWVLRIPNYRDLVERAREFVENHNKTHVDGCWQSDGMCARCDRARQWREDVEEE